MMVDLLTLEGELLPSELERPKRVQSRSNRVAQTVMVARRVLEGEGAGALTVRRLAEEMNIQAPSLYKHFSCKTEVELALIEESMFDIGDVTHQALHESGDLSPIASLLTAYRTHCLSHPNLYRLATSGHFPRENLPEGLEAWAGNPWFVVTGDPSLAQALWSFAHGMVILELDDRYPPGSDLESTWRAGTVAFEQMVRN